MQRKKENYDMNKIRHVDILKDRLSAGLGLRTSVEAFCVSMIRVGFQVVYMY